MYDSRKPPSTIYLFLFTIFLTLASACGKKGTPAGGPTVLQDGSEPPADIFDEGSGDGPADDFPLPSFDPGPQLNELEKNLQTAAQNFPDPEKKEAIGSAADALRSNLDFFNALKNFQPSLVPRLSQLYSAAEQRNRYAAEVLRNAGLIPMSVIYEQMSNTRHLFQVRDTRGSYHRYYFVKELSDLQALHNRLGSGFKFDGPIFPVWKRPRPSDHPELNIATRSLYGCEIKTGGTFVSLDSNCEKNSRTVRPAGKHLGYISQAPIYPEMTIRRYRHKRRPPYRWIVGVRAAGGNIATWVHEKVLGGAAFPKNIPGSGFGP